MGSMKVCRIDYIDSFFEIQSICEDELPYCDAFVTLISSWHFDNLLALIDLKKIKKVFCVITPEILSSNCSKFRITPEMISKRIDDHFFHVLFYRGNFDFRIIDLFKLIFKKKLPIIYICPGLRPDLRLLFALSIRPSNFWGIDEGLGTYISIAEFRKSLPNSSKNNFLFTSLKDTLISLLNKLLFYHMESYYLFNKMQNDTLELNTLISPFLRKQYLKYRGKNVKQYKRSAVLLIDNTSVVKIDDLRILICKIISSLPPQFMLYIKTHPNDSIDKLSFFLEEYPDVKILDCTRGAESCVAECCPQFLIGGYSTSLFVSSTIFGIRAISYMGLYSNEIPASDKYNNQIKYFMNAFRDNQLIEFPSTISDFLNKIRLLTNDK